ncbi:hypothetical protein M405DRAFT_847599 [Rhizopogon salebrosus TDB-379]|nr:hypothetical protein M405DRAFT_847599 [Rhizopogon salebrosus TDB-379]
MTLTAALQRMWYSSSGSPEMVQRQIKSPLGRKAKKKDRQWTSRKVTGHYLSGQRTECFAVENGRIATTSKVLQWIQTLKPVSPSRSLVWHSNFLESCQVNHFGITGHRDEFLSEHADIIRSLPVYRDNGISTLDWHQEMYGGGTDWMAKANGSNNKGDVADGSNNPQTAVRPRVLVLNNTRMDSVADSEMAMAGKRESLVIVLVVQTDDEPQESADFVWKSCVQSGNVQLHVSGALRPAFRTRAEWSRQDGKSSVGFTEGWYMRALQFKAGLPNGVKLMTHDARGLYPNHIATKESGRERSDRRVVSAIWRCDRAVSTAWQASQIYYKAGKSLTIMLPCVQVREDLHIQSNQADLSTTSERWVDGIGCDGEGATCSRLPDVLLIIVVCRDDLDALSDQVKKYLQQS